MGTMAAKDKGVSGSINDSSISVTLKSKLYDKNPNPYPQTAVNVQNGEVLLMGEVQSSDESETMERTAWKIKGVRHVMNHLFVAEPRKTSATQDASDGWITSQIKSHLLFDGDVRSINFSIKTINGIVYIMGTAQSQAEIESVTRYAQNVSGVNKVICVAKCVENHA